MKNRIKKIRKDFDLTQQKFADRIGVKQNTVAQYEMGRNIPIDSIISLICREFNVNEQWLRTGIGVPYASKTRNEEIKEYVDAIPATEEFRLRLFHILAKLNDDEWEVLEGIAKRLAGEPKEPTVAELEDEYKKSVLGSAPNTGSTALNTTGGGGDNGIPGTAPASQARRGA